MPRVADVATYFIRLAYEAGEPDYMTTMKLQKLLYYAQGVYLVKTGKTLFPAKIKAWSEGPVVPSVWHQFKGERTVPRTHDKVDLSIEERVFLRQIWMVYGRLSGDALSRMSHDESPWKSARGNLPDGVQGNAEISTDSMKRFFALQKIDLPVVPRPIEIRRGREVYRIEDSGKVLPIGF